MEHSGDSQPGPRPRLIWPDIVFVVLLGAFVAAMCYNTFCHNIWTSYDYRRHRDSLRKNAEIHTLRYWKPRKGVGQMESSPRLYYYLCGKTSALIQAATGTEFPHVYTVRVANLIYMTLVTALIYFVLLPRAGLGAPPVRLLMGLCLFTLPSIYLAQVMTRGDHLLLFSLSLLLVVWFAFDFHARLPSSRWRKAAWCILLVLMGNSRQTAIPAIALFLCWGAWLLVRHSVTDGSASRKAKVITITLVVLTAIASAWPYLYRFAKTGRILQRTDLEYHKKYYHRQVGFDRLPMFLNLEFHRLWERPNRHVEYGYGNNAVFPRLYGDMWADHWLYFSGPRGGDTKEEWKKMILVIAIPFTVLYMLAPLLCSVRGVNLLRRRKPLDLPSACGFLAVGGFCLLMAFIYCEPEVGKNSTVKFIYLLGYQWLPFFCIAEIVKRRTWLTYALAAYTGLLFALGTPLHISPLYISP